jgi:hypothetical protein
MRSHAHLLIALQVNDRALVDAVAPGSFNEFP